MNFVKPVVLLALLVTTTTIGISTLIKLPPKEAHISDITCLAKNIYYEARGEPILGQIAVAKVTVNRLNNGSFGNTICEVVFAKDQFSWTKDSKRKIVDQKAWKAATDIATAILTNTIHLDLDALYFHANHVKPRWSRYKEKAATIGKHIFYL